MTIKRIGYVSPTNPFTDRKGWSSLYFKLREGIEKAGYEVVWIPYKVGTFAEKAFSFLLKMRRFTTRKNYLKGVHVDYISRKYADSIDKDLLNQCECLFFPQGAQIAVYLSLKIPFIYFADATVHLMDGYYWLNMSESSIKNAKRLEEKACQMAAINIRSSKWAEQSVIRDCKCNQHSCHVLEFGPGIDTADIHPNMTPSNSSGLNLLFSGVDWERKGGDVAVETLLRLRDMGIDVCLTIVGPKTIPAEVRKLDRINFIGFLDKNKPDDYQQYISAFRKSDIFILPTKAECAGVVFSEASAFGLPCYTYATGGTTNYVISNYNGIAFPLNTPAYEIALQIYNDVKNNRLLEYKKNAFELSHNKLSWEAWAMRFKTIIEDNL